MQSDVTIGPFPVDLGPYDSKCENCDSRGADFTHKGHAFCCECMGSLTSWYLDGGMVEAPELFAWVLSDDPTPDDLVGVDKTAYWSEGQERGTADDDG